MKERILVPLDGSNLAEMALRHAVALARAKGYGLALLRLVTRPAPVGLMALRVSPTTDVWQGWDQELSDDRHYLEAVADRLRSQCLDVQVALVEDEPALGIVSYAERHPEVALIAMSTHGRSGLSRWVFGSVAEKVLHASPVPLLLVRPKHGERLSEDFQLPEYTALLAPLDGSVFAAQALDQAKTLAATLHARITLVSAVTEQPTLGELVAPPVVPVKGADETETLTNYLQENRQRLESEGFAVDTRLECGLPAEVILRVAEEIHADLIVMATHGRTGLPRLWLGSIAMKVVQVSTRPVLLVRAKERVKEPQHARARENAAPTLVT
jgi:nucleotide-binding universal stress UspA family protein